MNILIPVLICFSSSPPPHITQFWNDCWKKPSTLCAADYQGEATKLRSRLRFPPCWRGQADTLMGEQGLKIIPTPKCGKAAEDPLWRCQAVFEVAWFGVFFLFLRRTRLASAPHQIHLKFLDFIIFRFQATSSVCATVSAVVKFRWLHWILQHSSGLETSGFSLQFQTWHSPIPS